MHDIDACSKNFLTRVLKEREFLDNLCARFKWSPDELFALFPEKEKVYRGIRINDSWNVYTDDEKLSLHREVLDFASMFGWGQTCGRSSQLAIAILIDLLGTDRNELLSRNSLMQKMANMIISRLPWQYEWEITGINIFHIITGLVPFEEELPQYCS